MVPAQAEITEEQLASAQAVSTSGGPPASGTQFSKQRVTASNLESSSGGANGMQSL
jgi:hypothetical protein